MNTIAEQILAETEYQEKPQNGISGTKKGQKQGPKRETGFPSGGDPATKKGKMGYPPDLKAKTEQAVFAIVTAMEQHAQGTLAAVAFSGGSDSLVLLDLIHKARRSRIHHDSPAFPDRQSPYIIWIDSQMEWPGTREFVKHTLARYNLDARLRIAKAGHTPQEQWRRTGYPMLGKMAARMWMQKNRGQGFAINVSECCRAMKIQPARRLMRNLGCGLQFTGQRGSQDDLLRGLRRRKDGVLFYQQRDRMWIGNPLTGWTREDITTYIEENSLPQHPARAKGAKTIGCIYCGGGSQYTNSCFRILRFVDRASFKRLVIDYNIGPIILAIKYKTSLFNIQQAILEAGGLYYLLQSRPWVFDFTRVNPLQDTKGPHT